MPRGCLARLAAHSPFRHGLARAHPRCRSLHQLSAAPSDMALFQQPCAPAFAPAQKRSPRRGGTGMVENNAVWPCLDRVPGAARNTSERRQRPQWPACGRRTTRRGRRHGQAKRRAPARFFAGHPARSVPEKPDRRSNDRVTQGVLMPSDRSLVPGSTQVSVPLR